MNMNINAMKNHEEDVVAAKNYIGLPLDREMDEEERYFNSQDKEYDAFLAGVEHYKSKIQSLITRFENEYYNNIFELDIIPQTERAAFIKEWINHNI